MLVYTLPEKRIVTSQCEHVHKTVNNKRTPHSAAMERMLAFGHANYMNANTERRQTQPLKCHHMIIPCALISA